MADKVFVIYSTTLGTATARPVFEYYTEDETHVPDTTLLGYDANVAWVAVEPFVITDTADNTTSRTFTINTSTLAVTQTSAATGDVSTDQLAVKVQIETLIAEWNWTQELDAKITRATQEAFAAWIEQLEAIPSNVLWATNPKGITIPATPSVVTSTQTVAQQVAAATWLNKGAVTASKLSGSDWSNLIADDQIQDLAYWGGVSSWVTLSQTYGAANPNAKSKGAFVVYTPSDPATATSIVSGFVPIEPGKEYVGQATIGATGAMSARAWLQFCEFDVVGAAGTTSGTSNTAKTTAAFETTTFSGIAPTWARFARIVFSVSANGYPTAGTTPHIVFAAPILRRKVDNLTLGDDAVTQEKIQISAVDSRKMNIANWATLQPIWGFDWADSSVFALNGVVIAAPTMSWVVGRSGERCMRLNYTATGDQNARANVNPGVLHGFAASAGDTFFVEFWARGTTGSYVVPQLLGWTARSGGTVSLIGNIEVMGEINLTGTWKKYTGIITIPAGQTTVRWAGVRMGFNNNSAGASYADVDALTVTRVPILQFGYSQSAENTVITQTTTNWIDLTTMFLSAGVSGVTSAFMTKVDLTYTILQNNNLATDAMRLQFWLLGTNPTNDVVVRAVWQELAPAGQFGHRTGSFSWVDTTQRTAGASYASYYLVVSKTSSVGEFSLGPRTMTVEAVPRI